MEPLLQVVLLCSGWLMAPVSGRPMTWESLWQQPVLRVLVTPGQYIEPSHQEGSTQSLGVEEQEDLLPFGGANGACCVVSIGTVNSFSLLLVGTVRGVQYLLSLTSSDASPFSAVAGNFGAPLALDADNTDLCFL